MHWNYLFISKLQRCSRWSLELILNFNTHIIGNVHAHYDDVKMDSIASQITSLTSVYSTVHSGADQSKHQRSASLAFVWEIHRWSVNFPHKWPVTRKMFPFDDIIMWNLSWSMLVKWLLRWDKIWEGCWHAIWWYMRDFYIWETSRGSWLAVFLWSLACWAVNLYLNQCWLTIKRNPTE